MAGQRPEFIVRAKTGRKDDTGSDIFMTVGAAWRFRNSTGFNVRINALPVPFDGHLMLTEQKDDDR